MKVIEIIPRRRHLAAVSLFPLPEKIENAEYEEDKILIDREILKRCEISKDSELSLSDLRELCFVSECYRAKERAVWYLSKGDLSEKALFDKLNRGFSQKASAFAVAQMVKRGYIDDMKYAENLARRLAEKNVSGNAAVGKMLQKGVPLELAKRVLKDYKSTDLDKAYNLLINKYKNKLREEDGLRRTVAALQRRGFSYSDIKAALKRVSDENEEN